MTLFNFQPEPDMSRRAVRQRKLAAERARKYRERLRGLKVYVTEPPTTEAPNERQTAPKARICGRCRRHEIDARLGICPACWLTIPDCRKCHRRKAERPEHEGFCDPCWSVTPMYYTALARLQEEPDPEPPEYEDMPHLRAPAFDEDADITAVFGHGVAFAQEHGEFNPHDGMSWNGGETQREQLTKQIQGNARRRAGSQENDRG